MPKKKFEIELKPVRKSDYPFLYELLSERDKKINISHKEMPSYKNHVKFVMSKPYTKWYIIEGQNQKLGSIYLSKQDEIGIFIKKGNQGKGIGKNALLRLMELNPRERYLANVNPKNINSKKFFQKQGFNFLQYTYELKKNKSRS